MILTPLYREPFPRLNLRQWSGAIYIGLTHPLLDPTNSGRVVKDYVMKLITTFLEWSYAVGETDAKAETLQAVAELLTLLQDTIRVIYGAGPAVEVRLPEQEQGSAIQTEPGSKHAPGPLKRGWKKRETPMGEDHEPIVTVPKDVESEASSVLIDTGNALSSMLPKRPRCVGAYPPKRYAVGEPGEEHHG